MDIIGAMGHERPSEVTAHDVMKRVQSTGRLQSLAELFPRLAPGCLRDGTTPADLQWLQEIWDNGDDRQQQQQQQQRVILDSLAAASASAAAATHSGSASQQSV